MADVIPGSLEAALADLRERILAMRHVGLSRDLDRLESLLSRKRDEILRERLPTRPAAYWHPNLGLSEIWTLTRQGEWHYNISGSIVSEDDVPRDLQHLGDYRE